MADTMEEDSVKNSENHTDNHVEVGNCKNDGLGDKNSDQNDTKNDRSGGDASTSCHDNETETKPDAETSKSPGDEEIDEDDGDDDNEKADATLSEDKSKQGAASEMSPCTSSSSDEGDMTHKYKTKRRTENTFRDIEMGETDELEENDETSSKKDEAANAAVLDKVKTSDLDSDDESDKPDETHSDTRSADAHSDTEESEPEDKTELKPLPCNWHSWSYIRDRELGNKKNMFTYSWRATGSPSFVQRFKRQHTLDYHQGCVNTLHFNQAGNLLASGSDDLEIVLWDWARGKPNLVYQSGHKSNVFQAKFMPYSGDTTIVSCARDGQVRVGHLSSTGVCKGTKKLAQHRGAAHKLGLEPDSPVSFLSCGEDSLVYGVDLREDKHNKLVTTKENDKKIALYSIFINPMNTHEFAVGGRDHFVRVYDRRKIAEEENDGLLKKYCPHHLLDSEIRANVTCLVYNYNGTEILASYNDDDIYLFDNNHSDGADYVKKYKGHRNNATVKGVNFYGQESEFIVSGSDCGHVFLWEKQTERIVQFMEGDDGGVVNCLEPHPSTAVLATSGLDHDIKIWAPTAEEPTYLDELKQTMRSNRREREEERRREPDMIDGHMLWFIMHHLRRRARRHARESGERDSDESSSSDSEESEGSDDSGEMAEGVQCPPS